MSNLIIPPFSKSILHRYFFASVLSRSSITINNITYSDDVLASLNVLKKIGCKIEKYSDKIIINSKNLTYNDEIIDVNESGTTLRFAIPILIYLFNHVKIKGKNRLLQRPLGVYNDLFNLKITNYIDVIGKIQPLNINIDGQFSSQYISGLLFVLPLLSKDSKIIIENDTSYSYIDMTIEVLADFNIHIERNSNIIIIPGNQRYRQNFELYTEYDESSLSYLRAIQLINKDIQFKENAKSIQGDFALKDIIAKKPNIINCNNIPDLIPTLIFVCQFFPYSTTLTNVDRLKYKESNRLQAILEIGEKLGLDIQYLDNSLIIKPVKNYKKCEVSSYKDHRIAMMLLLFSLVADIKIDDVSVISKSYPDFDKIIERYL